jgi:dihydrofolate reductase
VDEMILLVNPVLLGKGKRLFAKVTLPRSFVFENTKVSPTGILANKYAGTFHRPGAKSEVPFLRQRIHVQV